MSTQPGTGNGHEHAWHEVDVYCETCGDHPGLACDDLDCDTVIDLVYEDDPR